MMVGRALAVMPFFVVAVSAQQPANDAAPQESTAPLQFAKVIGEEAQPRCFGSQRSPAFSDRLTQGQIVKVGASEGGFRPVVLPMGVTGYVHQKYCSDPADGMVRTSGARVSFRYRPRSGEAPAAMLPKDSELFYLETEGEWLKVRCAGVDAYLADGEVSVVATPDATIEAAYREFEAQRRKGWQDATSKWRAAAVEAAAAAERSKELTAFEERLRAELGKPAEERDFEALRSDLEKFAAGLDAQSAEAVRANLLTGRIEEQALLVRAIHAVKEEPRKADPVDVTAPPVPDPLARFDAVGWLRYRRSMDGHEEVTLEKGGRTLHLVTCESGRYDLRLFDGVEVGVVGPRERRVADSMRVLDALKIEVLGLR